MGWFLLFCAALLSMNAQGSDLDLEGFQVVKKNEDNGTIFGDAKYIAIAVKKSFFPEKTLPPDAKNLGKQYCGIEYSTEEKFIKDDGEAWYWALICNEKAMAGIPRYGLQISPDDIVKCVPLGTTTEERLDKSSRAYQTKLNCLEKEGWLGFKESNDSYRKHGFWGSKGHDLCRSLEKEIRQSPVIAKMIGALRKTGTNWKDYCQNPDNMKDCANGVSGYVEARLNCNSEKDRKFAAAVKSAKGTNSKNGNSPAGNSTTKKPYASQVLDACEDMEDVDLALQELTTVKCGNFDSQCNQQKVTKQDQLVDRGRKIIARYERDAKKSFDKEICCEAMPERFIVAQPLGCIAKPAGMRFGH